MMIVLGCTACMWGHRCKAMHTCSNSSPLHEVLRVLHLKGFIHAAHDATHPTTSGAPAYSMPEVVWVFHL